MTMGRSRHALAFLLLFALAIILALTACATAEPANHAEPITGTDRRDCSGRDAWVYAHAGSVSSHNFT